MGEFLSATNGLPEVYENVRWRNEELWGAARKVVDRGKRQGYDDWERIASSVLEPVIYGSLSQKVTFPGTAFALVYYPTEFGPKLQMEPEPRVLWTYTDPRFAVEPLLSGATLVVTEDEEEGLGVEETSMERFMVGIGNDCHPYIRIDLPVLFFPKPLFSDVIEVEQRHTELPNFEERFFNRGLIL